jgi:hypothetical protein
MLTAAADGARVDPARGWKPPRMFRGRRPNAIRVESTWVAIVFGTESTTRIAQISGLAAQGKSSFAGFTLLCRAITGK